MYRKGRPASKYSDGDYREDKPKKKAKRSKRADSPHPRSTDDSTSGDEELGTPPRAPSDSKSNG